VRDESEGQSADEVCHRDELRTLFLFESLTNSQLDVLRQAGSGIAAR
jgi:hypothetical protein